MDTVSRKTLTLNKRPLSPSRPEGGTLVGVQQDWTVFRYTAPRGPKLAQKIGKWLLDCGLYSKGNDFTSEQARDPNHVGRSTLANLWSGNESALDELYNHAQLWVLLRKGKPQGVVAWIRPEKIQHEWFNLNPGHPRHKPKSKVSVARLGYVMAFINPQFRGQGLVRDTLRSYVLPAIESTAKEIKHNGAIPLLGAGDAMFDILRSYSSIPLTEHMELCQAMRSDVWKIITRRRMWPERVDPVDKYLVSPVPFSESTKKRARRP